MLKKRLIFSLLYSEGYFLQSRNFNLQKVGNIDWLKNNYNFKNISPYIDELIVLDVSRKDRNKAVFLQNVLEISKLCFVPITVGGGIKSLDDANYYLNNASDKVLINSSFHLEPKLVDEISKVFGEQSIVVGIDLKKTNDDYSIYINNGNKRIEKELKETFKDLEKRSFGELLINSIDRDGTGNGLDYEILNKIPNTFKRPIIISGGTGNYQHVLEGFKKNNFNAISTANLLNFIGDGLTKMRNKLIENKINFPLWDYTKL